MLCCEEGNSEMAELLLNSQADLNLQQSVSGIILALYILDMYCIISK